MAAMSRRKGATAEREVCALLQDEFGVKVARRLDQTRDSGNDVDLGPFRIEVKRRKRLATLYAWMGQAISSCASLSQLPVVFTRGDGKEWLVVMRFRDWARLAREEIAINPVRDIDINPGLTD